MHNGLTPLEMEEGGRRRDKGQKGKQRRKHLKTREL
jgi:hypothetical protein